MNGKELAGVIVCCAIGLVIIIISILLLKGKGSFLLAGFNTMSEQEKEKYDSKALCRFMGKILLPVGIMTPLLSVGGMYGITWIFPTYIIITIALCVFAVVYCNTNHRFEK